MNKQKIKLSKEKSELQAEGIITIAMMIKTLDIEYLKVFADELEIQAHWHESAAVVNPGYNVKAGELMQKQVEAIRTLCKYAELLEEITSLKLQIKCDAALREDISKKFM